MSQDRLTSDELGDLRVDARTTRFLTETSTGMHYAAVGTSGKFCVITVQPGELSAISCAPPTSTARVAVDDTLLVVALSGPVPAAASGWREAGPDVFVNDSRSTTQAAGDAHRARRHPRRPHRRTRARCPSAANRGLEGRAAGREHSP